MVKLYLISLVFSILLQVIISKGDIRSIGYVLPIIIPAFSVVFICFFNKKNIYCYINILSYAFWILTLYGISQKIFGDYNVVIPGLTANYSEALQPNFLAGKHNMVWALNYLKLTSTYQNGNLFGVNYIIISWLYIVIRYKKQKSTTGYILLSALIAVMTASASVVIGYFFSLFLFMFSSRNKGFNLYKIVALFFTLFVAIGVGVFLIEYHGDSIYKFILARFLNRDYSQAGGRTLGLIYYINVIDKNPLYLLSGGLFIPDVHSTIYEMTLPSFLQFFGIIPTILIVFIMYKYMLSIKGFIFKIPFLGYLIASISDGGFWLPPTAILLFLSLSFAIKWSNYILADYPLEKLSLRKDSL